MDFNQLLSPRAVERLKTCCFDLFLRRKRLSVHRLFPNLHIVLQDLFMLQEKQRIQLVLQMDAGKMELKAAEFNLWGCIDFCMEMLVLRCENKGLYLSYSMDESVPE